MANEQNLKPTEYKLSKEEAKKGGKKSGETRRRKADMRKAVANILNAEYNIKGQDDKITGVDALAINLFQIAQDKKNKQCLQATRLLLEIYGQDKSPIAEEIQKTELEILKAKANLMKCGDDEALSKLDSILAKMENKANAVE